jgi:hypothetical protein
MNHARFFGLALSLHTGLVSPVVHAKFDDHFSTVVDSYGKYITKSQWQVKCGFVQGDSRIAWIDSSNKIPTSTNDIRPQSPTLQQDTTTVLAATAVKVDDDILPNVAQDYNSIAPTTVPQASNDTMTSVNPTNNVITRSGRTSRKPSYLDEYIAYATNVANTRQSSTITACTENTNPVSFILTGN